MDEIKEEDEVKEESELEINDSVLNSEHCENEALRCSLGKGVLEPSNNDDSLAGPPSHSIFIEENIEFENEIKEEIIDNDLNNQCENEAPDPLNDDDDDDDDDDDPLSWPPDKEPENEMEMEIIDNDLDNQCENEAPDQLNDDDDDPLSWPPDKEPENEMEMVPSSDLCPLSPQSVFMKEDFEIEDGPEQNICDDLSDSTNPSPTSTEFEQMQRITKTQEAREENSTCDQVVPSEHRSFKVKHFILPVSFVTSNQPDENNLGCTNDAHVTEERNQFIKLKEIPFSNENIYSPCQLKIADRIKLRNHIIRMRRIVGNLKDDSQYSFKTLNLSSLRRPTKLKLESKKPFGCKQCLYRTAVKKDLTKHITLKHRDKRFYGCSLCTFKSDNKLDLKSHLKEKHTNTQPFWYCQCAYKTAEKESLKKYIMAKHTNKNLFWCKRCPYKTAVKIKLMIHELVKHKDKKSHGSKKILHVTSLKNLKRNIVRKHRNELAYFCSLCSFSSAHKCSLKSHIEIKHAS